MQYKTNDERREQTSAKRFLFENNTINLSEYAMRSEQGVAEPYCDPGARRHFTLGRRYTEL